MYDGLKIDPCIPAVWEEFSVTRKFRGSTYNIKISNPSHVKKGIVSFIVNGKPVEGMIVPLFQNGSTVVVEAIMG